MNKTELINAMAEKAGLSKVDAKKALLFKIKRWNIINIQENLDKVEGLLMR